MAKELNFTDYGYLTPSDSVDYFVAYQEKQLKKDLAFVRECAQKNYALHMPIRHVGNK